MTFKRNIWKTKLFLNFVIQLLFRSFLFFSGNESTTVFLGGLMFITWESDNETFFCNGLAFFGRSARHTHEGCRVLWWKAWNLSSALGGLRSEWCEIPNIEVHLNDFTKNTGDLLNQLDLLFQGAWNPAKQNKTKNDKWPSGMLSDENKPHVDFRMFFLHHLFHLTKTYYTCPALMLSRNPQKKNIKDYLEDHPT